MRSNDMWGKGPALLWDDVDDLDDCGPTGWPADFGGPGRLWDNVDDPTHWGLWFKVQFPLRSLNPLIPLLQHHCFLSADIKKISFFILTLILSAPILPSFCPMWSTIIFLSVSFKYAPMFAHDFQIIPNLSSTFFSMAWILSLINSNDVSFWSSCHSETSVSDNCSCLQLTLKELGMTCINQQWVRNHNVAICLILQISRPLTTWNSFLIPCVLMMFQWLPSILLTCCIRDHNQWVTTWACFPWGVSKFCWFLSRPHLILDNVLWDPTIAGIHSSLVVLAYNNLDLFSRLNQSIFYPMHFDTSCIRVKDFNITNWWMVVIWHKIMIVFFKKLQLANQLNGMVGV